MKNLLLAVDIGTSACKLAVFRPDGSVAAEKTKSYATYYPAPGWVEQDPDEWWNKISEGIAECLAQGGIAPSDIAAVGIDGQSWSCIPVDREGNVLCRTPIWMDTRAGKICARVTEELGEERFLRLSGNPFQPFYTTPKILWFRENRPEVYRKTYRFLQSNSYIAFRLTGIYSQDISQGYGLHVFNIAHGGYDGAMCRDLAIEPEMLSPVFPCHRVIGAVTAEAAGLTGLKAGTPVVAGGLDAACAALGAGVCSVGMTQEQGGQAGGMSICLGRPTASRTLILSPHVVPGQWLLQGGSVGGGGSLRWFVKEFGEPERLASQRTGKNPFALLDELASSVSAGSGGVVFLPYLSGERSPIWDPDACGVFFGLDYGKTRAHCARAVLEGTAFALEHNLEAAEQSGVSVGTMRSVGGAANSRLWTQIKADVTGKTIEIPDSDNAATLGAAILAGVGVGVYSGFEDAVHRTVHIRRKNQPDPAAHEAYQKYFSIYKEIYRQLKSTMARAARISSQE
jgi:xylulokinase